ncbi:MAG: GNAT family N-acetyltransferase [Pseudomonadota bacterium]
MSVTIRPLEPTDREAWAELWRGYLEFYRTTRPPEIYDTLWERLLGDHPYDGHCLIAEVDGEVVGLTHYYFQRHGWSIEEVTYLQDLYAAPQVRSTGVGRALIEAVYAAADAAGRPHVYWLTEEDNSVGRRLYDRIGVHTPFIRYQRPL